MKEQFLFGARLRSLRRAAGLTQQEMADRLQIHRTTYTKYETQGVVPDPAGLLQIASMFSVTVDYLLGHQDVEEEESDNVRDGILPVRLTDQEMLLLLSFRRLKLDQRKQVQRLAEELFREEPSEEDEE